MNNSFCLAVFLAIVFLKKLAWEFAAETISIIVVQLVVGLMTQKTTHRVLDGVIVFAMYPLTIALVVILENRGFN